MDDQTKRIIFGLKVGQLRKKRNLSFADLAELSGMSVSYLNEIEKGKKYPRPEKIQTLAKALDTTEKKLISPDLNKQLAPLGELLRSNFLNDLPLELFGLDASKIIELLADAPTKVGAFISALMEIARKYALEEENFYFASLRSYQSLHDNYFEDLEAKADEFIQKNNLPKSGAVPSKILETILKSRYKYKIEDSGFEENLNILQHFRSIYLPHEGKLLINSHVTETQKTFLMGRELAFNFLKLKERVYTSTFIKANSFDEVLNNFKASYFSVAILLNRDSIVKDLREFFNQKTWNPDGFLQMMQRYNASPEMFFHRLVSLIPRYFGLDKLFFLRFNHNLANQTFSLSKELHLNRPHQPYGNGLLEHYCRRWITIWLLEKLHHRQLAETDLTVLAGAQRSLFMTTNDEYLCFTIARPAYPTPQTHVSVTIGIIVNEDLKKAIAFWNDPDIPVRTVHQTCERCPMEDCMERVAPPIIVERERQIAKVEAALKGLF